jgi:hypothetical protein
MTGFNLQLKACETNNDENRRDCQWCFQYQRFRVMKTERGDLARDLISLSLALSTGSLLPRGLSNSPFQDKMPQRIFGGVGCIGLRIALPKTTTHAGQWICK